IDNYLRSRIPHAELDNVMDNIGMPYSSINYTYNRSGLIGSHEADILVSLKENHRPTPGYVRQLRKDLPRQFPGTSFYFLPPDIVTQILNFGLPAPVDIQFDGTNIEGNRAVANRVLEQLRQVPGLVDLRIQQEFDQPRLRIAVDRTKASQAGFTARDIASSLLISLSGSFQTTPTFYLNPQNGVSYNLVTQT